MLLHYNYCPLCGEKLGTITDNEGTLVSNCRSCGRMWYDAYHCCVIVMTYNENNEVLLTWQPHLTTKHWVYTSGYINPRESAEEAAVREVKEELGIELEDLESTGTYWFERGGMLMHAFRGFAKKCEPVFSDEVEKAMWTDIHEAAKLLGPVRPGVADYHMLEDFAVSRGLAKPGELWPGEEL